MTFSFVKWIRVGIVNQMFSDPDHLEANGDRKVSLKATFCYISLYPQLECNFCYLFISLFVEVWSFAVYCNVKCGAPKTYLP